MDYDLIIERLTFQSCFQNNSWKSNKIYKIFWWWMEKWMCGWTDGRTYNCQNGWMIKWQIKNKLNYYSTYYFIYYFCGLFINFKSDLQCANFDSWEISHDFVNNFGNYCRTIHRNYRRFSEILTVEFYEIFLKLRLCQIELPCKSCQQDKIQINFMLWTEHSEVFWELVVISKF